MRSGRSNPRERGVALLQVLLLSFIISLLLLQLVYTSRGQLEVAGEVEQRIQADLLVHSAKNEALFSLLVTPGSFDIDSLTLVKGFGAKRIHVSELPNFTVETNLRDISGLLPLRFPDHPLWLGTLEALGMQRTAARALLNELKQMQDIDLDSPRFDREPYRSSSGFLYPNMPLQMPNSMSTWVALNPRLKRKIGALSHHYLQDKMNFLAAPDLLAEVALGEYGGRIKAQSGELTGTRELRRYLEDTYPYWIGADYSGFWRLDVAVETQSLSRRARYDFRLRLKDKTPYKIIGH